MTYIVTDESLMVARHSKCQLWRDSGCNLNTLAIVAILVLTLANMNALLFWIHRMTLASDFAWNPVNIHQQYDYDLQSKRSLKLQTSLVIQSLN